MECLACNLKIAGRSDKKFCCDQCRNEFHNKRNADASKVIRNINNILRKNRRILSDYNPDGKSKVSRDELVSLGFNFHYYTSTYLTGKGRTYFYCYEQGYLELEDDKFALVHKKEYVK